MLIEFRTENHRSLQTEQAISTESVFVRGQQDERLRHVAGHREPLLPVCALLGANASGKSNVLSAFAYMQSLVLRSHSSDNPQGGIGRYPFAWNPDPNVPSTFEVEFLVDEIKYAYGFSVNDDAVAEEWLHATRVGHKSLLFAREGDKYKFGSRFRGPNKSVQGLTRHNALFVSVAAQLRHEELSRIRSWFDEVRFVNVHLPSSFPYSMEGFHSPWNTSALDPWLAFSLASIFEDQVQSERLLGFARAADLGIVDARTVPGHDEPARIQFRHQSSFDDSWLELEHESSGTLAFLALAEPILRTLSNGGTLVVDELESSLHPLLCRSIVDLFNSPRSNPKNAQLLFTTHDANLLGTTLGAPALRRDQIWFAEKNEHGATSLYPLTDYKPRTVENLERGYLQGRYGAVPFLGAIEAGATSDVEA